MYCSHSKYSKNCLGLLNLFLAKVLTAGEKINVFNVGGLCFFGISLSNHTLADDRAVQCLPSLWRQLQCWARQKARWWGGVRVGGGGTWGVTTWAWGLCLGSNICCGRGDPSTVGWHVSVKSHYLRIIQRQPRNIA